MFLDVPLAVRTPGLAVTICSLCLSVCRQNNSKKVSTNFDDFLLEECNVWLPTGD